MEQLTESIIAAQLDPDELLLWSGQPRLRLRAQDAYTIPFSLLWLGFAIFWEVGVLIASAKAIGPIPKISRSSVSPSSSWGSISPLGDFLRTRRCEKCTYYGVTNDRIIIVSGLFSQQTKSLQLRTLSDVTFSQRADGSGTIAFGPTIFPYGFGFPANGLPGSRPAPPAFEMIEDVKRVYDVIRAAQKGS